MHRYEEIVEIFLINYRFPLKKHPDLEWTDSDEEEEPLLSPNTIAQKIPEIAKIRPPKTPDST